MFKPHFQIFLLFCRLCQPGHIAGISRFFQRDFLAEFEGSDAKKQARIYLTTFGIDYDAITKEQFVNLVDVLKLSKHMKSLTNQRGRARPYQPHGIGFHVIGLTPSYEHPAKAGGPFFIRYQPWVNAIIAPKDTKQLTANQAWTSSIPPEAKAAL